MSLEHRLEAFRESLTAEELEAFRIVSMLCKIPSHKLIARAAEQNALATVGGADRQVPSSPNPSYGYFNDTHNSITFTNNNGNHPTLLETRGEVVDPRIPASGPLLGYRSSAPANVEYSALQGPDARYDYDHALDEAVYNHADAFITDAGHHSAHPSSFSYEEAFDHDRRIGPPLRLSQQFTSQPQTPLSPGSQHVSPSSEADPSVQACIAVPVYVGNAQGSGLDTAEQHDSKRRGTFVGLNEHVHREEPRVASGGRRNTQSSSVRKPSYKSSTKRKAKACLRCSVDKKSCKPGNDHGSSCKRCQEKNYSMDRIPCISVPVLNSLTLFRTSVAGRASEPYQSIGIDSQILTMDDTKYGESSFNMGITQFGPVFPIQVRRFAPPECRGELTTVERRLYSHEYCIEDLKKTEEFLSLFLELEMLKYIGYRADSSDRLTMSMFGAVGQRAQGGTRLAPLLKQTLKLWTASRTIEGGWKFYNKEGLDLSPNESGDIPLVSAPMIDYQFAALMMQRILLPLRSQVLKQLEELTKQKQPGLWLDLMLINYVLLDSLGRLMCQQRNFARQNQFEDRYPNRDLAIGILESAKSLLGHYNLAFKKFLKNFKPFKMDWRDEEKVTFLKDEAQLSDDDLLFLKEVVPQVKLRMQYFNGIIQKDEYDNPYWFTGQLFLPDWSPPDTLEFPNVS